MTAELEYSFIDVVSDLKIGYELMTRAVRVKQAVRDKLSRVYLKNLITPVVNNEQEIENKEVSNVVNSEIEANVEKEVKPTLNELVDLSEENLKLLNSKLSAMESQQKVPTVYRRAVLFTNNLISKINNVSAKWFDLPSVEQAPVVEPTVIPTEPVTTPTVDLPKVEFTNHLGGEVIPGTWDDMPEKVETAEPTALPSIEQAQVAEPAAIPVEPVVPTIELTPVQEETATLPPIEPINVEKNATMPEVQTAPVTEPVAPSVPEVQNIVPEPASIPEIKLPDLNTKTEREVPDFMPKLFAKVENEEPEKEEAPVEQREVKAEEKPAEPVVEQNVESASPEAPEPVAETQEIDNSEFVPEPTEISGPPVEMPAEEKAEENVPEPEVEPEKEEAPVEQREVKVEEKPTMSIEDRIAELLNKRKEEVEEEPTKEPVEETTEEEPEVEVEQPEEEQEPETPEKEDDAPEISQATIIAKLQRFNNSMKEKDAEIKNLREKNQKLSDDNASIKDKMNDYDTVLKDLTNKNNDLVTENEKLSNKNSKIEEKYKDKVESLENQVEELTKAKKEEMESSKNAISEIKEKYENEIEELKKKFADDLKKANESNERKIRAIYNTISETLGDSLSEDQEKSM